MSEDAADLRDDADEARKDQRPSETTSSREPAHDPNRDDRKPSRPPWGFLIVAVIIVAGLLGWGVYAHWRTNGQAAQTQQRTENFVPTVRVAVAKREDAPMEVVLPGQTEAFQIANVYGRATGYIAERKVDIGSRVRKGDLLARIAAPDLDAQLAQAEAQLGQVNAALVQAKAQVVQAQATLTLQTTNLQRANTLTRQGFETVQNQQTQRTTVASQQAGLETAKAGVGLAEANVKAQQATVDRLKSLAAFENVTAPFDGVVTARNVEVGDLINADAGTGSPMFSVEEDDLLRVAIEVPQYASEGVRDGVEAKTTVPELPGRTFPGKVARTTVALLYSSRTMSAEVDVPNPDGALRPGLYVNVSLAIPRTTPIVNVPADALIFNQKGMQVAVVQPDATVKMRKIEIARDLGTTVDVKSGLNGGEKLVMSAPPEVGDGSKVKIADDHNETHVSGSAEAQR
jgi:RND family efflux transporter MFP subunit